MTVIWRVLVVLLLASLAGCGAPEATKATEPTMPSGAPVLETATPAVSTVAVSTGASEIPAMAGPLTPPKPTAGPTVTFEPTQTLQGSDTPGPTAASTPAAPNLSASGPTPTINLMNHPDIVAIRTVFQEVNKGINDGSLKVSERVFDYCEPGRDTKRVIATDTLGRVHMYRREAGSEDSALAWEHYYDNVGRLRFVFITGGAVNGSVLEHRIYFDENSRRIWEQQKYTAGPGYTFPEIWPVEDLQMTDPAAAFAADVPACE